MGGVTSDSYPQISIQKNLWNINSLLPGKTRRHNLDFTKVWQPNFQDSYIFKLLKMWQNFRQNYTKQLPSWCSFSSFPSPGMCTIFSNIWGHLSHVAQSRKIEIPITVLLQLLKTSERFFSGISQRRDFRIVLKRKVKHIYRLDRGVSDSRTFPVKSSESKKRWSAFWKSAVEILDMKALTLVLWCGTLPDSTKPSFVFWARNGLTCFKSQPIISSDFRS